MHAVTNAVTDSKPVDQAPDASHIVLCQKADRLTQSHRDGDPPPTFATDRPAGTEGPDAAQP